FWRGFFSKLLKGLRDPPQAPAPGLFFLARAGGGFSAGWAGCVPALGTRYCCHIYCCHRGMCAGRACVRRLTLDVKFTRERASASLHALARSRPPPRAKAASRPPSPAPATNRHRIARCAAILMVETFARRHFSSEALAFGKVRHGSPTSPASFGGRRQTHAGAQQVWHLRRLKATYARTKMTPVRAAEGTGVPGMEARLERHVAKCHERSCPFCLVAWFRLLRAPPATRRQARRSHRRCGSPGAC